MRKDGHKGGLKVARVIKENGRQKEAEVKVALWRT